MDENKTNEIEDVKDVDLGGSSSDGGEPEKGSVEPDSTGDADSDGLSEWEETFKGKTPKDVARELEEWKKHARQWEKRAKQNKADEATSEVGEELARVTAELGDKSAEVNLFRDLIALQFERDAPIPFADLADSIAFRDAYRQLDRQSDDFVDRLGGLVDSRSPKARSTAHVEVDGATNRGADLYERLFKNS